MDLKANELEALVRKVAGDVLSKVVIQPILILVPLYVINLQKYLEHLDGKHPGNGMVLACMNNVKESIPGMKQVVNVVDISGGSSSQSILDGFDSYSAVYCISPGIKLMENITRYNDTGFIENLMIYSLIHGKPAGILTDYDAKNLPGGVSKKVREITSLITGMGITVENIRREKGEPPDQPVKGKGRELITEKDIDTMYKNGIKQILSANGCIITPLAKDRARELGVTII